MQEPGVGIRIFVCQPGSFPPFLAISLSSSYYLIFTIPTAVRFGTASKTSVTKKKKKIDRSLSELLGLQNGPILSSPFLPPPSLFSSNPDCV